MDNYDEIEFLENIEIVINTLKNKKVLFSIIDNAKTYFTFKKNKIMILGNNSSFLLSVDKFKELYNGYKFYLFEDKEDNFDFQRDEEYYRWKHK